MVGVWQDDSKIGSGIDPDHMFDSVTADLDSYIEDNLQYSKGGNYSNIRNLVDSLMSIISFENSTYSVMAYI